MKYKILKSYIRKYTTENEITNVRVVVIYVTENDYLGKIEIPEALTNKKEVEAAIKKDINNALKICRNSKGNDKK